MPEKRDWLFLKSGQTKPPRSSGEQAKLERQRAAVEIVKKITPGEYFRLVTSGRNTKVPTNAYLFLGINEEYAIECRNVLYKNKITMFNPRTITIEKVPDPAKK